MATNTYVALRTTTVTGSSVSSVTLDLTGISGYTDLVVVANYGITNDGYTLAYRVNGDTGTNYSWTYLRGNGTVPLSYRKSGMTLASVADEVKNDNSNTAIINFQNYSNSTTHKTSIARTANAGRSTAATVSLWRSTSPITSIVFAESGDGGTGTFSTGNITVGSTFTIYGIASAEQSAKATGGYITSDDTYTYHMFTSTGTLTPKQSLSADVLVIAGGGGGGYNAGGGGGAGGLRLLTAQSLTTSTAYTATVGAGGAGGSGGSGASGSVSSFAGTGLTTISASGGGQGQQQNVGNGSAGGSGGGAAKNNGTPYSGNTGGYSPVEGYAGGTGGASGAAGGGGAGGVGGNGATNGGTGGVGNTSLAAWLTATGKGVSGSIAGGGGGGSDNTGGTATGGGGVGGNTNGNGTAAIANTGGGGGGGGTGGSAGSGAAGGSGIVIIRYPK